MSATGSARTGGKKRSGNPARRAEQKIEALWPIALDYFVQASRVGLYEPIDITTDTEGPFLDLPGVGPLRIDPTVPTGAPVGVVVITAEDADWAAILCHGADPQARTQAMLDGLTEAFVSELGSHAAAKYARSAVKARPVLSDPTEAMRLVDYLLGRANPADRPTSTTGNTN